MITNNVYRPIELINLCPSRRDILIEVMQISKKATVSSQLCSFFDVQYGIPTSGKLLEKVL